MSRVNLVSCGIPIVYNVSSMDILVSSIVLNQSVTIIARCYDLLGNFSFEKLIKIEGEEYLLWGTDDNYLMSLAASKLGVTIAPEVVIPPIVDEVVIPEDDQMVDDLEFM
jgi:hypothetical protein